MSEPAARSFYIAATLLPAGLILLAGFQGGVWPLAALASLTLMVIVMDRLGPGIEATTGLGGPLPWAVGAAHFATLGATIWVVGQSAPLDTGQKVALVVATGLFAGQVSNSCAHELIHRKNRASRWLGTAIYSSIFNGQHVSAHLLVHHVHAGTARDPNSAPLGRGFYRYALTATRAEFLAGLAAENRRRAEHALWRHPYLWYLGGSALSLLAAAVLGGRAGVLVLLIISAHAQMQLLLSDYVQHYGLRRAIGANGKPEPMGPQHSWNAPQPYSAALMLNAPLHSDHHMAAGKPFTDLALDAQQMPVLPHALPVMGAIALIPPLWRRLMDPRARVWSPPHGTLPPQPAADMPVPSAAFSK